MTEKHSPLPWRCYHEDLRGGRYWVISRPGSAEDFDIHEDDNGEADAALIVRSVNGLPEAVAALEDTKGRIMNAKMDLALKTKNACGVALAEAICEIDAALTKLKG